MKKKLIFKGGTALHHCYLSQKRFSEDLDFTSLDSEISKGEIVSVLESTGVFQVRKNHTSKFTLKIERLQYQGLLGQPGNIKLEIDHYQNNVLPGVKKNYKNVWKIDSTPLVMDKREICAEKIRATAQRARYRDFYDLYFLIERLKVIFKEPVRVFFRCITLLYAILIINLFSTLSIRIVADFGTQIFQFTTKFKRATNLKFTTVSAIIFIHCCTQ